MDIDLDDLISTDAAAKGGIKFQPKGKSKPKPKPKPTSQPEPKSTPTPSTQFVEVAATTEEVTGNDVNQIIGNVLDSLRSSSEKSQGGSAESFLASDSPNDFLPKSTTTVNLPPCSETPTVDVSMDGKLEAGPTEPELINNIDASTNLECVTNLDPLTGDGAAILNDNEDFQIGNMSSSSKEAENSIFWEPLDILGPRVGKFKPKPKARSRKMEQIANNLDKDVGTVQRGEINRSAPSQIDFMENEPVPSFTPDDNLGTSDYHVHEESTKLTRISQAESVNDAGRSPERLAKLANNAHRLTDEAENDGNNNNDDHVPENESLTEKKETKLKSKSKSNKPHSENKKLVRKRKNGREVVNELIEVPKKKFSHSTGHVVNELIEVPKKKFSHSTRRNRRPVNPELLKIPEDEFELHMHNYALRDLIRLREHKERIEKKEASLLGTDTTDQSDHAQNATYYNYRTHMKITPRMKWTKQDTELFYEAIQQFGIDLSIIKECFPGRTREQIRSKFKKEYKQHRLRIESALNTRTKGHSHFEFVIERLKQAQAEDSDNDDPFTLTGEKNEVEAADINEGGTAGLQKEVKDMEPDVPAAAESPIESNVIEDDTWSQYKSDI